jgi:hypothetical protein
MEYYWLQSKFIYSISIIPSSSSGQRLIKSRLAAIRGIFVNNPALGSLIDG